MTEQPVLFDTFTTASGHVIGTMTLNDPKALNALSVDMCKLMASQLATWAEDNNIVAVILRGAGDKAFCAGGNIRNLYDSMLGKVDYDVTQQRPNPYAVAFFQHEYDLYRQMHFYAKPLILWGNGIVMGGGIGLMAMCSHRVVTETTRFAMPEITIGLYPDATGSWFLARMPAKVGLFLGLTGVNCNANDAFFTSLAEFAVASDEYDKMIEALKNADWQATLSQEITLKDIASRALSAIHHTEHLADSHILANFERIRQLVNLGDICDIDRALRAEDFAKADTWLSKAVATYKHGCPVSAALTVALFHRASKLSLEQVLYMEMNVSLHCADSQFNPNFREGVRALLIDKDKSPKWDRTLEQVTDGYIQSHLKSAFAKGQHPFENWLGDGAKSIDLASFN